MDKASWNVLAITARPSKQNDLPHRLIARANLCRSQHHLKIRPPGYFKVVHLDLHSIIHSDE
jgi:hypothetical protein